jgi:BMFP domain-containing protein YqiC
MIFRPRVFSCYRSFAMPQTRSRLFDDFSRLMSDAAGLAEGAWREVETLAKSQLERLVAGMDLVSREEFDAAREMAALARAHGEKLEARLGALEARVAALEAKLAPSDP